MQDTETTGAASTTPAFPFHLLPASLFARRHEYRDGCDCRDCEETRAFADDGRDDESAQEAR